MAPSYSTSFDYDSNRRLEAREDARSSEAGTIAIDVRFKRALENLDFTIEPRYVFRRYSDSRYGNGDDRSVYGAFNWNTETTTLNVTASYWDQSTLVTEQFETGIVSGNTHRRLTQAQASWTWAQTERRALVAQISDSDTHYYGQDADRLPGYKYPSGSLGERFNFSERGSFTLSAYGSKLLSDSPGNSSHSLGVQGEVVYAFSERTNLDANLGRSRRNLAGSSSSGTDASITFSHSFPSSRVQLVYTRNLVPYGNGFLAQREQYTATFTHSWSEAVDTTLSVFRIKNNETAVLLRIDRRSYDNATASINWRPTPTWAVSAQVSGVKTQTPQVFDEQTVKGYRGSIGLSWIPLPTVRSW